MSISLKNNHMDPQVLEHTFRFLYDSLYAVDIKGEDVLMHGMIIVVNDLGDLHIKGTKSIELQSVNITMQAMAKLDSNEIKCFLTTITAEHIYLNKNVNITGDCGFNGEIHYDNTDL
jgi:hypothetical protein